MTSLKINTIVADTTTTFSQVPSISATVTAYPTVGTTIPTTTWVQNTINTLLSPYALISSLSAYAQLSSADFTAVSRNTYPLTSAPNGGFGSIILCGTASCVSGGTIITPKVGYVFPINIVGVVATIFASNGTTTITTSAFNNTGAVSFKAVSSSATAQFSYICFGY